MVTVHSRTVPEHLIDLDADPFVPNRWKIEEHRKGGQFKWDGSKVALYLSKKQQSGKRIKGNQLRKELRDKSVYNAKLLDYLLKNTHLIPEKWKGEYVFFWRTVYRNSDGYLFVRFLCWLGVGSGGAGATSGSATTGMATTLQQCPQIELIFVWKPDRASSDARFLVSYRSKSIATIEPLFCISRYHSPSFRSVWLGAPFRSSITLSE